MGKLNIYTVLKFFNICQSIALGVIGVMAIFLVPMGYFFKVTYVAFLLLYSFFGICSDMEWNNFVAYCGWMNNWYGRGFWNIWCSTSIMLLFRGIGTVASLTGQHQWLVTFAVILYVTYSVVGVLHLILGCLHCSSSRRTYMYDSECTVKVIF